MIRPPAVAVLALLLLALAVGAEEPGGAASEAAPEPDPQGGGQARISVRVAPEEATVGDRIDATLELTLPPGTRLVPPQIGPTLGRFSVIDGAWTGPEQIDGSTRWRWNGAIVAFRTGDLELPSIRVRVDGEDGSSFVAESEPVTIHLATVLEPEESLETAELADLKPPAGIRPDYGPLFTAAVILGILLVVAAIAWWLHRLYAARFAAVPAPEDPFHRTPPHVWVYAELQKLLERRLAEQGQVGLFFEELSRIVKLYLGGRFRVDLLEQTTGEVPDRLREAGAPPDAIDAVRELLAICDGVKFAKAEADSGHCRQAVEAAYEIVDATKPREAEAPAEQGAA